MQEKQFSKFIFGSYTQLHIFAYMAEVKEDNGVISVRPPEDSDMKEKLQKHAENTERSMNFHAVKAIEEYLKKYFKDKK